MSKGTILYVGSFELPDNDAASHRVLSNAKIFRELGYDVVFMGCDKSLSYDFDIIATAKQIQGFDSFFTSYPTSKKQWIHYLSNIDSFKKVLDQYKDTKFVICYNYQAIALKRIMSLCKKKNISILSDCNEWYSAKNRGLAFFLLKGFDVFYRMTILHKKLDGLIVISNYLERYYKKSSQTINIPPLVDLSEEKWQAKSTKKNDIFTFVYAGSPGKKDKIDIFLKAINKTNIKCNVNIVGITKEEYLILYPNQEMLLDDLKSCVNFIGRVSHITSLNYVKNADCSCFFRENNRSTKAGFPTKLAESISADTLVLTNASSNVEDYFSSNQNGVCLKEVSESNIINAIEFLIKNKENIQINCNIFDYRNYVNQLGQFIDKIVEEKNERR